jgi:hypothetical protein
MMMVVVVIVVDDMSFRYVEQNKVHMYQVSGCVAIRCPAAASCGGDMTKEGKECVVHHSQTT